MAYNPFGGGGGGGGFSLPSMGGGGGVWGGLAQPLSFANPITSIAGGGGGMNPLASIFGNVAKGDYGIKNDLKSLDKLKLKTLSSLGNKGKLSASTIKGQKLDMSGVNAIKDRALQQGPSAWANLATDQQRLEEGSLLDQANRGADRAAGAAKASLAMSGGLRSGSAERLAAQGADNALLAGQDVRMSGATNRGNILLQDQIQKDQFLSQLPGAQLGAAQYGTDIQKFNALQSQGANQFNVGNTIGDLNAANDMNKFKYGEKMKLKGASMAANATANAGKK